MMKLAEITARIMDKIAKSGRPSMSGRFVMTYLGDSVYVHLDGIGRIVLTTHNGKPNDPSNTIVLEPEVWEELKLYVAWLEREAVKP